MSTADAYPGPMFSSTNHEIRVLTARHDGRENGQVATWIMPATLVPDRPRVAAVLSPQNFTHELIRESGRFVLHLLSSEQHALLPLFGASTGREVNKFEGLDISRSASGIPVIEGCCGWAECRITRSMDLGDRVVYAAEILEQQLFPGREPLRKKEAFAAQPEHIRKQLEEKHRVDGERDRGFLRTF